MTLILLKNRYQSASKGVSTTYFFGRKIDIVHVTAYLSIASTHLDSGICLYSLFLAISLAIVCPPCFVGK